MTTPLEQVQHARSLAALLALLRGPVGRELTDSEWTSRLPTFGGREPRDTTGVWSWDRTRVLVGTCADDLRIEPRKPAGRPPVTGTTRGAVVLVRVTPAEKEQLTAAAARSGSRLGPWLRSLGIRHAESE